MRRFLIAAATLALLFTGGMGVARADHAGTNPTDPGAIGGHPALYGLCTAYFANGGNGNSHEAPPFAALEEAADAAGDGNGEATAEELEAFCENVRPGNGHGQGGDNSQAPSPTDGRGNGRP